MITVPDLGPYNGIAQSWSFDKSALSARMVVLSNNHGQIRQSKYKF